MRGQLTTSIELCPNGVIMQPDIASPPNGPQQQSWLFGGPPWPGGWTWASYRRPKVIWVTPLGLLTASARKRWSNPFEPVPEPFPAAQHDGRHDDVQVIDQVGGQERADG